MPRKILSGTRLMKFSAVLCAAAIAAAVPYSNFCRPLLSDAAESDGTAEQPFPFLRYSVGYQNWDDTEYITIEECDKDYIGNLIIPEYIEGIKVASISSGAFEECMNLTGIDIPKNVQSIENRAFADCFSLKTVIIRNEMCMIADSEDVFGDDRNFYDDDKVVRTLYSAADSYVSEYAQRYGLNFSSDIPELEASPTNILPYLTYDLEYSHATITGCDPAAYGRFMIPQYIEGMPVSEIAEGAFENCAGISELQLPDSLYCIRSRSFYGCSGLKMIELPELVRFVEDNAFTECSSLETVIIRNPECEIYNSPETICNTIEPPGYSRTIFFGTICAPAGSRAEKYANDFNCDFSTEIPESPVFAENALPYLSYEEIGGYIRITKCSPDASGKLIVPSNIDGKSVIEIYSNAFMDCKNIVEIELPSSIMAVDSYSFAGCTSLRKIDLGRGVHMIGDSAFLECGSLETVIIRSDYCNISSDAFNGYFEPFHGTIYGFSGSTAQEYAENNGYNFSAEMPDCTHFSVDSGSYLTFENAEQRTILTKCDPAVVGKVIIPKVINGTPVEEIAEDAFMECPNITAVVLPDSVHFLNPRIFAKCESLCEVILPDYIFSISNESFLECVSLKKIRLPENLVNIGGSAFGRCQSLEDITIPAKVSAIESGAFSDCESLKKITILNPHCSIYGSNYTICNSHGTDSFSGVICGYDNSTADKYAEQCGYAFESLGPAPETLRGDANYDGIFSISDAVMLERWLLGSGKLTAPENVDLCKDGVIDSYDMCLLRKELVSGN
ncbi:MAG: leucine-rich repeat protein [Alistipes sp.]|nr:leucine-rich repeat protein [Alistipes sp.]